MSTAKLVIEIDGRIHTLPGVKENDAERQKYLEELGLKVLRFSNEEISHNLEGILQVIEKNIK